MAGLQWRSLRCHWYRSVSVAIDLLASVRSTALIALVSASFASPIVVKSDAFASAGARLTGTPQKQQVPTEPLVAGGVEFAMPTSWGRLGTTAAASSSAAGERIGTVVTAACPGGSAGAACADGPQLTFIAYSGAPGHDLPRLAAFERQLDARLGRTFSGFRKGDARSARAGAGLRWLDYPFAWDAGSRTARDRFAAYRHKDGSGVVVAVTGTADRRQAAAIEDFLESAAGA